MQADEKTWVLVTRNSGKAREFEILLNSKGIKMLTLGDIGYQQEIKEEGKTFEENAIAKLDALAGFTQYPILADDSGLEVDALDGQPGVYSARYAGPECSDEDNRHKLLKSLHSLQNRTARFVCVLGYRSKNEDGHLLFRASCEGTIALHEAGANGFGYDPVFIPQGYDQTFGELDSSIKMQLSHRAKAAKMMIERLF